jgi:hypothetical protein
MKAMLGLLLMLGTVSANASNLDCSLMVVRQAAGGSESLTAQAATDGRSAGSQSATIEPTSLYQLNYKKIELRVLPLSSGEVKFEIVGLNEGSKEKEISGLITRNPDSRLQSWTNLSDYVVAGVRCN